MARSASMLVQMVLQGITGMGLPTVAMSLLRRLWPMMLTIVLGTLWGSSLLANTSPQLSGMALGIALLVYAGYALIAPTLTVSPRFEPWLAPLIGLVTGVVTGITGVFVMPAVPYLQALNLNKDELVQALGLSFTISTLALAGGLFTHDVFKPNQLSLSTVVIIPALLGLWLGQKVRVRISPRRFKQYLLLFLAVLGLQLIIRPFI
ncbi:sulfite exporter TauE/SafE family protein [Alcaligenes faecalis]|nr:sulfite exporter TauE/SafE family protein [Alcaligenes faecalis]